MGAYETQGFNMDNTGRRIVVDPVTRIEGHMRCEVNLDSNNVIRNAVSTGTMWRGLEVILKGRDPRDAWAFVERICGVCTGCHALTSVRAVEDALGIKIPLNAHLIREMMAKTLQVHDHAVHFYHLHALDWVDVVSCLKADPKKTSELQQLVSPAHPLSSPGYFRDVQNRLKKFVESGQLGPFAWWRLPRSDGRWLTVWRLGLPGQPVLWLAPGLLQGEGPPDGRDADLAMLQHASQRLVALAAADGATAVFIGEQGPLLAAEAPAQHAAYWAGLLATAEAAVLRGDDELAPAPAWPGLPPAWASQLWHALNWQRAWRQVEAAVLAAPPEPAASSR